MSCAHGESFEGVDVARAHDAFREACQCELDLRNMTGETGDMAKDKSFAYGDTALTFENVSFTVRVNGGKQKVILEPISGHFHAGSLVAVMGPSGSGKTTLLDILANKKCSPHGGTVHFNGRPRDKLFQRMSSYVAQDDIMPAHLTVEEAVTFHHRLKHEQPSKWTHEMLKQRIHRSLEDLGLLEVKDSWIGDKNVRGISGGQRRRVSLACGLAAMPQIMFCDEPTSGLSATDAETCVQYMRLIAHKYNVTILVVIHQPRLEVAKLFDHLLLLAASPGRCAYNGPMSDLAAHCGRAGHPVPPCMNPTDFVMDIVTPGSSRSSEDQFVQHYRDFCKEMIDRLVKEELHKQRKDSLQLLERQRAECQTFGSLPPIRDTKFGVRFRKQLLIVAARQMTLYCRDSRGIIADLVISVGKGLLLGLTYLHIGDLGAESQLAFFFMLMMAASMDGMKGMPKLIADRKVMKMETSAALYSEWAYIIPFTIISWMQAILANTIFVVILCSVTRLPWALFGSIWLWTTMLYLTMDSMFLMLSAVAKDSSSALVMALPFFMLFLLFNGFTVSRKTAPWYLVWIVNISPVAYSIEQACMAAQRHYNTEVYIYMTSLFGYRYQPYTALSVMVAVQACFRTIQVISLKFLNNIQR